MPFNGEGVFTRLYNWVNDANNNITIQASRMDNEMNGFATGLSDCITKDGQQNPASNLPMNGYRHTGVGSGQATTDYAALGQVQNNSSCWCGTSGGTANAITLTPTPAIAAYAAGQRFQFIPSLDNTGAATVAVSGFSAVNITKTIGNVVVPLTQYDIIEGVTCEIIYDGTEFLLLDLPVHSQGSDIASAATIDLDGANGDLVDVTGATSISAVTLTQGRECTVRFTGSLALVNSASLTLPGNANIVTQNGDIAIFRAFSTGVACTGYNPVSGYPVRLFSVHRQLFTTSGTYTPSTAMLYCDVEAQGCGGGGGGAVSSGGALVAGGGGGAGGYARKLFTAATIGASQTVTIGAAGTGGGNSGGAGGSGGASTLGSLLAANGGAGGTGAANPGSPYAASGGAGGGASGGDVNVNGYSGGFGLTITNNIGFSGKGGDAYLGAGGAPVVVTSANSLSGGAPSGALGAGGSGAVSDGVGALGGAGAVGFVLITEYCAQ